MSARIAELVDAWPARPPPGPSAWQRVAPRAPGGRCGGCPPAAEEALIERLEACLDAPDVAARLARDEAEERYPEAAIAALREVGLADIFVDTDREHPSSLFITMPRVSSLSALAARRSASLAITLGVNALALLPAWIAASDALLRRAGERLRAGDFCALLLSELAHGSNLLRCETRAEPGTIDRDGAFQAGSGAPTHFRLTGEKDLINGGERHALLVTLARTREKAPGDASAGPLGGRGDFTIFLVERDETCEAMPRWRTLPAQGADISGVRLRGTIVPAASAIGGIGEGFAVVQKTLSVSRGGIAALASGCASRAVDLGLAYARRRDVYGGPITTLGAIQEHLLRCEALDLVTAAVAWKATAAVNALGLGAAHHTAVAKYVACALAEEAVREARQVLGGRALLRDSPFEPLSRDVLLYGVFDGTSHVMIDQIQWRLAQAAFGFTAAGDPLAEARRIFTTPPRRMIETLREKARAQLFSCEAEARALAALPGEAPLAPIADLSIALFDLVRGLRAGKRWEPDQALRFECGDVYATIEALIATVELADPQRRAALGIPAGGVTGRDALLCRFALGLLGARALAHVRQIAQRMDLRPIVDLEQVEQRLLAGHEAARAALRATLSASPGA